MIVASRTANGHSQRRRSNRLENLVHAIGSRLPSCTRFLANCGDRYMRTSNEVTGSVALTNCITRDLFKQKTVIWFVFVEGTHNIVAVDPCIFSIHVTFAAVRLSPTDHIKPMLGPSFPKMRRLQEPLHKGTIRCHAIVSVISEETVCHFRRWWKSR